MRVGGLAAVRAVLAGLSVAAVAACGGTAGRAGTDATDPGAGGGDEGIEAATEAGPGDAQGMDTAGEGVGGLDQQGEAEAVDPGETGAGDAGPDGDGDGGGEESPFYPSSELFLKIVFPSSDHFTTSSGSLVALNGLLFGEADTVRWESPKGAGDIVPQQFWMTEAIPLDPGDNLITVTATKGKRVAKDRILVTYTPGFLFGQRPLARPDVVFVNEPTEVVFTIRIGDMGAGQDLDVTLHAASSTDFSPVKTVGPMVDDGDVWENGDEVAKDGIYTYRGQVKCATEGLTYFRVGVPVTTGVSSYVAYSSPFAIECVAHLSQADCLTAVQTQKAAWDLWNSKKGQGEEAAREAVLEYLSNSAAVKAAGREEDGYGVWAWYKSGVLGALSLSPAGVRAGAGESPGEKNDEAGAVTAALVGQQEIASKRSTVLSPYAQDLGGNDETEAIGSLLSSKECPTYDVSGPLLGSAVTLQRMREAMRSGVVVIATHGDTFFGDLSLDAKTAFGWSHTGSQEALFVGDSFSCTQLLAGAKACSGPETCPAGTECVITEADETYLSGVCVDRTQADLRRGRVAIGNGGGLAVLPSFVERYGGRDGMPDSLVYLGACRTAWNGTMAGAFLAAGAKAVAGYTGYVSSAFAAEKGAAFFEEVVGKDLPTGYGIPEDAEDPDHPGSRFVLIGARELSVTGSHIVNEGFERGDLTGWTADGDGRVISKLGITKPVAGKFMGIISTGLGFTVQTGSIEQTFCIPPETYGLSFYWKYYSEEFHEFCGSQYQDTFQARIYTPLGQEMKVVDVTIDDLCDPSDCSGCCQTAQCVGLVESDVQFDQQDTHVVPKWQKAKVDISAFAGKGPVTLSFFATDQGDSIYDTVILIDSIRFK